MYLISVWSKSLLYVTVHKPYKRFNLIKGKLKTTIISPLIVVFIITYSQVTEVTIN